MRNIFYIFILAILSILTYLFLNYYLERKNIIFKKCLDVVPSENMIEISSFKINVDICKKQN